MSKRITGITVEIGGDTTKLNRALKETEDQLKRNQSSLKDINSLLKLDPGNTTLLKQKYSELEKCISNAKTKLDTLRQAEKQMREEGKANTQNYENLQREIAETEIKVKSLTKEMNNMGSVSTAALAAVGGKIQKVGTKIEGAGRSLLPVSAAVGAVVGAAATKYAEVDKTMKLVNATMGNTEEEALIVQDAMRAAAQESVYGMSDAAKAMLNFARAGKGPQASSALLAPAMALAAGEGGDLDLVSNKLVATMNAFSAGENEAAYYADVLAAACNASELDINSLMTSMSVAAPIFAAAGYNLEDTVLNLGLMGDKGIDASVAARSLRTGLARLVSPTDKAEESLKRLKLMTEDGQSAFFSLDGEMADVVEIQKLLHEAFAGLSEQERLAAAEAIFGKNQMAYWLALIDTAPERVQELNSAIHACTDTANEMKTAMQEGFGGSVEMLKSNLDVLAYDYGKVAAEVLLPFVQWLTSTIQWIDGLDDSTKEIIVKIGLFLAAAAPVLIIVGKLVKLVGFVLSLPQKIMTAFDIITGGINALGGSLSALWGFMLANPIVLVIAAIVALAAAFIYLYNTNEEFRQFWNELWVDILDVVHLMGTDLYAYLELLWTGIKECAVIIWEAIRDFFVGIWTSIKDYAELLWTGIKECAVIIWEAIRDFFVGIWTSIKDTASNTWNAIKDTVVGVFETATSKVTETATKLKDSVVEKFEAIRNFVQGVVDFLKGIFDFEWKLPRIKLPHFSISGGFSLMPPSVPQIDVEWYKKAMEDGIIMNRPTAFGMRGSTILAGGEAGPEAVVGVDSLRQMVSAAVGTAMAGKYSRMEKLLEKYLPYLPRLANMNVVLDSGEIVGFTDARLGQQAYYEAREGI